MKLTYIADILPARIGEVVHCALYHHRSDRLIECLCVQFPGLRGLHDKIPVFTQIVRPEDAFQLVFSICAVAVHGGRIHGSCGLMHAQLNPAGKTEVVHLALCRTGCRGPGQPVINTSIHARGCGA